MAQAKNWRGESFGGFWIATGETERRKGNLYLRCRCSGCCDDVHRWLSNSNLRAKRTTNCGCQKRIRGEQIEFRGRSQNIPAWAKEVGLSVESMRYRLQKWKPRSRAFLTPPKKRPERLVKFAGRCQNMTAWAAEIGLTLTALCHRLRKWKKARALTTPPDASKRHRTSKVRASQDSSGGADNAC